MTTLQSVAVLLCLCASGAYINERTVRLPPALAMVILSLGVSFGLLLLGHFGLLPIRSIAVLVHSFDFPNLLLHDALAFLLFAGALFVDTQALARKAKPIASMAILGVISSAFVVGFLIWLVAPLFHAAIPFLWCVLFGALIAPTDPIATLAIVRRSGAPYSLEVKLIGESLFNDGIGVMLFVVVLEIIRSGSAPPLLLFKELFAAPIGAAIVGFFAGKMAVRAMGTVDHVPTELMITLALAAGVYGFAEWAGFSAPIAVVVAGLIVGHDGRNGKMSQNTRQHLVVFWEGIDETLNALLFVLIGLELLIMDVPISVIGLAWASWVIVVFGRTVGVLSSLILVGLRLPWPQTRLLVWGGLRGGISLALALSIPDGPEARIVVPVTFVVVTLSMLIQGLSLGHVASREGNSLRSPADKNDTGDATEQ
jgi:CPA1 family monovalent cation:H+ antiporter